jgi:hypothetical protein
MTIRPAPDGIPGFFADPGDLAELFQEPVTLAVVLPSNITRIESQASLYEYGVVSLGFVEVADEQEAIERAEGRTAFLLKSKVLPVWYLIFPHVIVQPTKG